MAIRVTAALLALIGLVLLAGGGWLLSLGGSAYYLLAGLGFLITAILLFQKNAHALSVYAVIIVASLAWALWEVGLDWWQLGPRGGVIILIGIWLLTPWIRVPLGFASPTGYRYGVSATPLAIAVVLSIVVAVVSMFFDPYDQAGELPQQQAAANPAFGGNVPAGEWHQYGRTPYGQRYSPLDQISVKNVKDLQEVWRYQTGDVKRPDDVGETTYQVTPLKVGNSLYLCTPHNWAIALDAATGKEKWKYDANAGMNPDRQHQTCRGVSYYKDEAATPGSACAERVYLPTSDARLIALDAANGQVCTSFADKGVLHLETGMKYNPAGYYYSTSPPAIAAGKIIIGGAVNDNYSTEEQSGVIRAYDVNTGQLLWNWDSGNPTATAPLKPGETYTTNSPNSWSVFSVDEALGLVYVPLGNQVPDQLGMGRSENVEKYSSSIVALDINSGADRWVRQTVHHDLWDMDVPAQPVLLDIPMNVQREDVDPELMEGYSDLTEEKESECTISIDEVRQAAVMLRGASRPMVLVGGGVRSAGAVRELREWLARTEIPAVCSLMGLDAIETDYEWNLGLIGSYGHRYANLAVANCDCLLVLGSRLDTRQTGTRPETFARGAKIIQVEIDRAELGRKVKLDLAIRGHLKPFMSTLAAVWGEEAQKGDWLPWKDRLTRYRKRYPTGTFGGSGSKIDSSRLMKASDRDIDPNRLMERLGEALGTDAVICLDVGQHQMWASQSLPVEGEARLLNAGGMGAMGFGLPAAIGAAFALPGRRIALVAGDGGMQVNIQELQTVVHWRLPISFFVLNNRSLGMVRQFQDLYFAGRQASTVSGYSCPDFVKVAEAYGVAGARAASWPELNRLLESLTAACIGDPFVAEIAVSPNAAVHPKLGVSRPIEDMEPLLSRHELHRQMIVPPLEEP